MLRVAGPGQQINQNETANSPQRLTQPLKRREHKQKDKELIKF